MKPITQIVRKFTNETVVSKLEIDNKSTMKNYPFKTLFFALLIGLAATSCQKDEENDPVSSRPDSFSELKADNSFNWSTADNYTIHYKGTPVGMAVKKPLTIQTEEGEVIRQVNLALSENAVIDVRVPSKNENLVISWGTHQRTIALGASSTIEFSFVKPDTEEL